MTNEQFIDLRIGDIVSITVHGKNKNKTGIVDDIIRGPEKSGTVLLFPYNCEFELAKGSSRMVSDGAYIFKKREIKRTLDNLTEQNIILQKELVKINMTILEQSSIEGLTEWKTYKSINK